MAYDKLARGLFRYAIGLHPKPPKLRIDGKLDEWEDRHLIPDLTPIEGGNGFARVYAAWDADGLAFGIEVTNKKNVLCKPDQYLKGDEVFLWIDTRDARSARRANRYCHYYRSYVRGGPGDAAFTKQLHVQFAQGQAPLCKASDIQTAGKILRDSYCLEIGIPARVLNGFNPSACPRIGLFVQVVDQENGEQFWPLPPPFQFWSDPSFWGTVELLTE